MANENSGKKKLVKGRHMSAIKRQRQNVKRNARNSARKSAVRTAEKSVLSAIKDGDAKAAQTALVSYMSDIDKAAQKGVIHFKRAARRVSRLSTQIASLGK